MKQVAAALLILLGSGSVLKAEVKPSAMFGNGMVLQREMPVPVWGAAAPGEQVRVRFAGRTESTRADADGKWMVKLNPLQASARGVSLTITGTNTLTFTDVLVGEVWVCSGQSIMQLWMERVKIDRKFNCSDLIRRIGSLRHPRRCQREL